MTMRLISPALLVLLLSGCVSSWDMHGTDPKDFYKQNPIVNKVEETSSTVMLRFSPAESKLRPSEADYLEVALRHISPPAADSIEIEMTQHNFAREESISKVLRRMGYESRIVRFAESDLVEPNQARVTVSYAVVVAPHCPDWRTSPVTSYSNTWQGNFGCANTVNLGMEIVDPHDLVRGQGDNRPDTARTARAISQYHTATDVTGPPASGPGAIGSSSAGSSSTTTPSP